MQKRPSVCPAIGPDTKIAGLTVVDGQTGHLAALCQDGHRLLQLGAELLPREPAVIRAVLRSGRMDSIEMGEL